MKTALFIPCYVDQFYPDVGLATAAILEHFDVNPEFPEAQTCCGQPMLNTGCPDQARPLAEHFLQTFAEYDHIVAPSGSCVSMVRNHFGELLQPSEESDAIRARTLELSEFLTQVLDVRSLEGAFPHAVGLHQSCHGLRELRLGGCSEVMTPRENSLRSLLQSLEGLRFTELKRPDECCGFGGTFAVTEQAVSSMMGMDRLNDHLQAGTEVLTAGDMSCLMHLDGLVRRNSLPLRVLHFAEILAEALGVHSSVRSRVA